jgi:hypothetical protein
MAHATHHIKADHVALLLALRKANPRCQWLAVSNGFDAGACGSSWHNTFLYRQRLGMGAHALRPMVTSLYQEGLQGTIKKVLLTGGPKEVKRTWGVGFKALMAEISGKGVQ